MIMLQIVNEQVQGSQKDGYLHLQICLIHNSVCVAPLCFISSDIEP